MKNLTGKAEEIRGRAGEETKYVARAAADMGCSVDFEEIIQALNSIAP